MLSLDGYYTAGPDDDLTWFRFEPQLEEDITSTQLDATALLFGRRTWEEMASYWPHATGRIAEFMNRVPKLVCSRTLTRADWPPTELVRDDVPGRRSEEHTSELQSRENLVCRLLLEKKN